MAARPEEVFGALDARFPFRTACDWDNSGWQVHHAGPVRHCLVALDPSPETVAEAVAAEADLIVTHHPLFFPSLTALDPSGRTGRVVRTLLEQGIGLLAVHTPADRTLEGISGALAERLGLGGVELLQPEEDLEAVLADLRAAHPNEEVAFDLVRTHRKGEGYGLGAVGEWSDPLEVPEALARIKEALGGVALAVTGPDRGDITRVAVMGGSADALVGRALEVGAQLFVGGDLKYHTRLEAADRLVCVDPGHRASEQPGLERLARVLREASGREGWDIEVDLYLEDPGHARVV
jgi:dinuclear metal center YbgI/SA1388 family protein